MLFLFGMILELVAVEVLLRAIGASVGLRTVILVIDAYSILIVLAVIAACITRPHVVSATEVRVRYGAFFDLRIPGDQIASVRQVRNYNENGAIKVEDDRLAVAVSSSTNLILELTEPITAVRPLGRHAEAADDPPLRRRAASGLHRAAGCERPREPGGQCGRHLGILILPAAVAPPGGQQSPPPPPPPQSPPAAPPAEKPKPPV